MLVVPALLVFFAARAAHAQESFGAPAEDDATAAPPPTETPAASAASDAPFEGDEWWHKKEGVLPPKQPPNPMALRFDGGFAPRRLFAIGVTGADMGFGLGVQETRHLALWWATRVSIGSTENGLGVWSGRTGAEIEAVFDPLRFGVGASAILIGVDRASRPQTLHAYGFEARAFVRFDCFRSDDFALFLRGAIDGGVEASSGSAFWGPGIGAGVELGVRGKKRPEWARAAPPIPML